MPVRKAHAVWEGSLQDGNGKMALGSGAFEGPFSFGTRFGDVPGTNPEELIGAAHAGCFSMALSGGLGRAGYTPNKIETRAEVKIERGDSGFRITNIHLITEADVPGIDEATFQEQAEATKKACPVSQALAAVDITMDAKLVNS